MNETLQTALNALVLICNHSSRHCELLDKVKSGANLTLDEESELAGFTKASKAIALLSKQIAATC